MTLFARWCDYCLRAWPVVEGAKCERCGRGSRTLDLLKKATELGQELKAAKKETAKS